MNGKHARNVCAECRKLQHRLYYQQNKEKTLEDNREHSEANREIMLQQKRRYRKLNWEIREKAKEYSKTEHAKQIAA